MILNCADTALTVTEIACDKYEGKVNVLQIARTYAFDLISEFLGFASLIPSRSNLRRIMARTGNAFGKEGTIRASRSSRGVSGTFSVVINNDD